MLNDEDFFAIADRELEELNLADRINLQYKIGNYEDIPFADDEKVFLTEADARTFEDCLALARKLYEWCKQQQEQQRQEIVLLNRDSDTEGKPQDQNTEEEAEGDRRSI